MFTPEPNSTFGQWYGRYEAVFTTDAASLDDQAKARLLLRNLSQDAYNKFVALILPQTPGELSFNETVAKLKTIYGEPKSRFQKRYDCLNVEKYSMEDFVTYGARVNRMCEEFLISTIRPDEFKALMFTIGLKSDADADTRTRMLALLEDETRSTSLNIEKLISEANRVATLKVDNALVKGEGAVHAVRKPPSSKPRTSCWGCGEFHYYKTCPFNNKQCPECKRFGHKAGHCQAPKAANREESKRDQQYRSNHVVALASSSTNFRPARKYVQVVINNQPFTLQLDNGSDFTIISEINFLKLGSFPSRAPTQQALDASNNSINFIKEFDAELTLADQTKTGTIKVTKNKHLNVLGSDFMDSFGLFDRPINDVCLSVQIDFKRKIQDDFPDLFSDTPGRVTRFQPRLNLREGAEPIFRAKRPVPFAKMSLVEAELKRLSDLGIITQVDFSDYAAPIVAVQKKSGSIRVCGDYATGLNDQLQSCQYPLPTGDEIFAKLSGCKIFSKIDLSDAFLQVEIHPESRKLLTIHTHKGLFEFNRLPPGAKPAPGIFQQIIETALAGLPGVAALMDDVLIAAETRALHDDILKQVFQRLQELGFRIKMGKCEFHQSSIKFLGRIIDSTGSRPDPEKITAILDMQAPTDVSQLRSLLGAINYHGKHIKNLRMIRAPLDELTKRDTTWSWTVECQKAFDELKAILSSDLHLVHYDSTLPMVISADASTTGIGAYLAHKMPDGTDRMIACASRSLDPAEKNYSQIEKEGLAIVWAVKKFHRYVFGRRFTLCTDHQPLLRIFGSKKGIPVHVANRLQRWAIILLAYDFDMQYVNTNSFGYVDVLSRLMQRFPNETKEDYVIAKVEADTSSYVKTITSRLPINDKELAQSTNEDHSLQKLLKMMRNGWPESKKAITDVDLQPYWEHRASLSDVQGVIMLNDRVVVPKVFRQRVIETLHEAHPGIDRMKGLARSYVYWPNIDKDLTLRVQQCAPCARTAKMPVKTLLKSWPLARRPLERIHIDIAEPEKGDFYLVIVDAHSKWPEVFRTKTVTSTYVIDKLTETFSRYGKPELIVSDNGTQFVSEEFTRFCMEQGIEHLTTAYYQPQSNGEAERFIDTLKRHLERMQSANALERFLLYYRSSPNKTIDGKSPAELFLGRKMRTVLDLLRPSKKVFPHENWRQNSQFNQKHGAKERRFAVGDLVLARVYNRNKAKWIEGQVVQKLGDVLYEVATGSRTLRSHANQLRKRHYNVESSSSDDSLYQLLIDVGSEVQAVPVHQHEQVLEEVVQAAPITSQPYQQRTPGLIRPPSTRIRRPPVWMQDYE